MLKKKGLIKRLLRATEIMVQGGLSERKQNPDLLAWLNSL